MLSLPREQPTTVQYPTIATRLVHRFCSAWENSHTPAGKSSCNNRRIAATARPLPMITVLNCAATSAPRYAIEATRQHRHRPAAMWRRSRGYAMILDEVPDNLTAETAAPPAVLSLYSGQHEEAEGSDSASTSCSVSKVSLPANGDNRKPTTARPGNRRHRRRINDSSGGAPLGPYQRRLRYLG